MSLAEAPRPRAFKSRAVLERAGTGMSSKLYEDSLKLTVNKNLQDIRILLQWAEEAYETREKIQHAQQALDFLREVVETLRELHNNPKTLD